MFLRDLPPESCVVPDDMFRIFFYAVLEQCHASLTAIGVAPARIFLPFVLRSIFLIVSFALLMTSGHLGNCHLP